MTTKECCHFILLFKILYLIFGSQNDLKWNKLSTKIVGLFEYYNFVIQIISIKDHLIGVRTSIEYLSI
jgi:hypothetical protein